MDLFRQNYSHKEVGVDIEVEEVVAGVVEEAELEFGVDKGNSELKNTDNIEDSMDNMEDSMDNFDMDKEIQVEKAVDCNFDWKMKD